jgi:predicted RNA-binding Zn-ribbon protein involved in translation (DUF1610 family)
MTEQLIDEAYRATHRACPMCLNLVVTTLLACTYIPDVNRARCEQCGWVGTVEDLVQERL